MADFKARLSGNVSLEPWDDPASTSPDRPSRLNPNPEHIHKRWVGIVGQSITVVGTVDGALKLDSQLGGELFSASFLEAPSLPFPVFTHAGGLSALQFWTPTAVGHYTLQMSRTNHGSIILHVDVDS